MIHFPSVSCQSMSKLLNTAMYGSQRLNGYIVSIVNKGRDLVRRIQNLAIVYFAVIWAPSQRNKGILNIVKMMGGNKLADPQKIAHIYDKHFGNNWKMGTDKEAKLMAPILRSISRSILTPLHL